MEVLKMKATKERWLALCRRMKAKDNLKIPRTVTRTYVELLNAYTESRRHFHNLFYISDGLNKLDEVVDLADNPDTLEMAWWWIIFIYDPTEEWDNEENSALASNKALVELGISPGLRSKIFQLIMAIRHDLIPEEPDCRLIADIYHSSLAASPNDFDRNMANIRRERFFESREKFRKGLAEYFREFLKNRPSIYLTDYFRNKYEAQAQKNLQRIISTF